VVLSELKLLNKRLNHERLSRGITHSRLRGKLRESALGALPKRQPVMECTDWWRSMQRSLEGDLDLRRKISDLLSGTRDQKMELHNATKIGIRRGDLDSCLSEKNQIGGNVSQLA
jgi:hypothetical protein